MDVNNDYGVLQTQKDLLILLKEFDQFCIVNDIKYSVIGGTLLGAIRHKGFIPWDDDLDIIVDRSNYNKMKKLLPYDNLVFETDTRITLWIDRLKLHDDTYDGTKTEYLDVFVIDNRPDNVIKAIIKLSLIKALQGMIKPCPKLGKYSFFNTFMLFLLYLVGLPLSFKKKIQLYQSVSVWGNKTKSKYKMIYNDEYSLLSKIYPSDILDFVDRIPFEDTFVYGIHKYEDYLTYIYGDYMTLPEQMERLPKHRDKWIII